MTELSADDITAEQLAQKVVDVGLLDPQQIEAVWGELGTRSISARGLETHLLRRGLLTNLQVDKLVKLILKNERWNFFYGKYKVMYLVGEGSFARVYRAVHRDTGEVIALKVLRNRHAVNQDEIKKFLIEAKMVMQLRHAAIVPIHEVGTERGRPYMVMEFVEGQNLREMVRVRKKLTLEESLRLMADVCAGLEYALSKKITHRDLKLSNVLVTSAGRGKLVDFGLAALAAAQEQGLTQGMSARSIHYAGLERATSVRKDDPRSDIYFAGCMLYHMVSGQPPLAESSQQSQLLSVSRFREVPSIIKVAPDCPRNLVNLINRAMELDAEKRYQTPGDFLVEIKHVASQLERGETGAVDASGSTGADLEGLNKSIMVIESDPELQATLREQLKKRGYRVLVFSDPVRALARLQESDEKVTDGMLFGTAGSGDSIIEAFNRLDETPKAKDIPAVLFVHEDHKASASKAVLKPHRVILSAPLKVRELRAVLLKVLSSK